MITLGKNGKEMRQRPGMKAIGPMKMKQLRRGKEKAKKGHGPQDQGKGQGDGKGEAICPSTFFSTLFAAGSSTFVIERLRFLCDTFFCVLDISQDDRE